MSFESVKDEVVAEIHALVAKLEALFHKSNIEAVKPDNAQDIGHPAAEVAIPATTPSGAPNNPILDAYMHSNPQYHDTSGGQDAPTVDTSGPVLDFAKVGNGVPIPLNISKTIQNCPASVTVEFNQASGQSGATNTYVATVNEQDHTFSITAEQKVQVSGPEVRVSVSCPGLQMEIRG